MIRTGAIGPDHRANLRLLRASFQAAFDAVEDPSDRTTAEFAEAEVRYKIWIKAIDGVAMALLDDVDTWEAITKADGRQVVELVPQAASASEAPDLVDLFASTSDFDRTRDLIGSSDVDIEEKQLYEEL